MSSFEGVDPVMLELFRGEMETHLPALNQGLLTVEKGQAGAKDFEAMMRAAHSIKGAARIVGIDAAVRVAHAMEDCFSAAQHAQLTLNSDGVDVLLQGVDTLQRICAPQGESTVSPESIDSLLGELARIRENKPASAPSPAQPETSVPAATGPPEPAERCVTLPAALDRRTVEPLRRELAEVLRGNAARLRLDFGPVEQVSADGLALLACLARERTHREPPPVITAAGVSTALATLLRTTGLDRVFNVHG